jgi:hypothetical protein
MPQLFGDLLSSGNSIVYLPDGPMLSRTCWKLQNRGLAPFACIKPEQQEFTCAVWYDGILDPRPLVMLVKQGLFMTGVRFERCDRIVWVGEEGLGSKYKQCMQSLNRGQPETAKIIVPLAEFIV